MQQPSLTLGVVNLGKPRLVDVSMPCLRSLLRDDDTLTLTTQAELTAGASFDAVVALGVCGATPLALPLINSRTPALAFEAYQGFHPFHAAFNRALEAGGGIVLPAVEAEEIRDSFAAVRARKALQGTRLLVVDIHEDDFRAGEVAAFAAGCRARLGVEIIRRSVDELRARAAEVTDAQADAVLAHWYAEVLEGPGEMETAHLRQVARLYLAERALLEETGAAGITVEDILGFLLQPERHIMPNVSYGALVFEGFLAAEEGDVEVLASELLLQAGLDAHPTMSNLYLLYRDRYDAVRDILAYTPAMQQEDYQQCLADDHLTASHFRAFGVLPPNMMTEERYRVREAWPGQSMVVATPKLGPVTLARLTADAAGVHLVPGEADRLHQDEDCGWYRDRWFIHVPSVRDFIARCQHQHYAIGPGQARLRVLRILTERLLGLTMV